MYVHTRTYFKREGIDILLKGPDEDNATKGSRNKWRSQSNFFIIPMYRINLVSEIEPITDYEQFL